MKHTSRFQVALAVAAMAVPGSLAAQDEPIEEVAAAFGARGSVLDISLSPSGGKLAYIAPTGLSAEVVYVFDLETQGAVPQPVTYHDSERSQLEYCDWANEEQLVCQYGGVAEDGGVLLGYSRMIAVAADGSGVRQLTARDSTRAMGNQQWGGSVIALDVPGEENRILMTRQFVPEFSVGSFVARDEEGLGVESVDITDGRRANVERPDETISRYLADETGRVRLKAHSLRANNGLLSGEVEYYYRPLDSNNWVKISRDLPDFTPVAVDSALNVAYGFEKVDGFDALFTIALDGSNERKEVLARDDVDVDSLIRIGRQRRVVGASYATEKRSVAYIDEELEALMQKLGEALPGEMQIDIADASADERKLLLIASSDVEPGMAYLLNRSTGELSELMPLRDTLAQRTMAPMQPIVFPAADGTQIPGYLTLPPGAGNPMKAIVLPHGGPGSRDEWGFDWLVQFFAARGYAVLQPNFRGSTGYGEAWFGRNGFQAWETAVGDVNDAGRWLISEGIADPARLAIVGWSYGGYAALQSQILDPGLYQAVAAIAPVTDLEMLKDEARFYTNSALVARFVGDGPHVRAGSPVQNAGRFEAPVMLFHGTEDINVGVDHSRLMEQQLREAGHQVSYVEYEGLDHYLDNTWARGNMLYRIDTFLGENLGR